MPDTDIEFIHLPDDEASIEAYTQSYKNFRLKSLLLAPSAFSSTYAREVAFPDALWKSRLLSSLANIFIAQSATSTNSSLGKANFKTNILCHIALMGPLTIQPLVLEAPTNPWDVKASTDQILKDAVRPWHFRLHALFTLPGARGKGLAKDLILMAVDFARDFTQRKIGEENREFVVSIAIEKDNVAAGRLYEKCGFRKNGEVVYKGSAGDRGERMIILFEHREKC